MTVLHRNIEALSTVHPEAARQLALHDGEVAELQLHQTQGGNPSARYRGRWLHSSRDPYREAERAAADPALQRADLIVYYGFGLGYHVEAVARTCPNTPIVVLEPDLPLLRAALRSRRLEPLLSSPRVRLVAGPDAATKLAALLAAALPRRTEVRRLRTAVEEFPAVFAEADETLSRHNSRAEINRNTLKRFGRLWVRNLMRNIAVVAEAPGVSRLAGRFDGLPAVVCAAGPSLDEVLPWLPALQERAVIVAVDTSIEPLFRSGVRPDFLVTVDPQYWNTRHLDRVRSPETALISESATHPRVFRLLSESPCYLCSSLFPLGQYLERTLEPRGALGAGGSVATSAWDFARILGCRPVYAAGLDLGFPGRATHCRGSFFEEAAHGFCNRTMPVERYAAAYLWDGGARVTRAADGGTLLSDRRMLLYKWWFESQIEDTGRAEGEFYTLSGRSIAIEGMPPAAPAQALGGSGRARPSINRRLRNLHAESQAGPAEPARRSAGRRLDADLEALSGELQALEDVLRPAVISTEQILAQFRNDPHAQLDLSVLDRADGAIAASERREIIGFLIHETTEQIFSSDAGSGEQALLNSKRLYEALVDSTRYHLRLIHEARERLRRS